MDKAIKLVAKAKYEILGVFAEGEKNSHTHDKMLENLNYRLYGIRQHNLPRWATSEINSAYKILFQYLYIWPNPKVVWRHVFDGVQYASWSDMPEAGRELGRQDQLVSGHFWAHSKLPFSTPDTNLALEQRITAKKS